MKKILTFIGSGGQGDVSRWKRFQFHHTNLNYEKFVTHMGRADRLHINLPVFDSAIHAVYEGDADAVFCETPEAMLFRFVEKHRNLDRKPFIILGCDVTYRLEALNTWLKNTYNIDFMKEFLADPLNLWMFTTKTQEEYYVQAGIPREQLCYLPSSICSVEILFPAAGKTCASGAGLTPGKSKFLGLVTAPGNNNRDFETFCNAVRDTRIRCAVICDRRRYPMGELPRNVSLYDVLPLKQYIAAVRDSLFVVIPLRSENEILNGGQMTASYAARLGKACVATRCDAIEECVRDGETGVLVNVGDVNGMRAAIHGLASDPGLRRDMGLKAVELEKQMSGQAKKILLDLFTRATS